MIPIRLYLSGFLSYREPVELDFTAFELACIAGPNGAGKSSLLDAITWALFGQARKRDDSVINSRSALAQVGLIFAYEGNLYQVQRTKARDRTMLLEFQILQGGEDSNLSLEQRLAGGKWKPLSERTLRETEARIQQTLRMDYETFTNASFFLQGKADQFTQQRPGDRKRILTSILGLEVWERYKERAADRRKGVEAEIRQLEGRLQEINAELSEETARVERLGQLEGDLGRLGEQRLAQEAAVGNARQVTAALKEQEKLVEALARQVEAGRRRQQEMESRLAARRQEKDGLAALLGRAGEIEAAYAAWQAARAELERLEAVAGRFRQQEKEREAPRLAIQAARSRLEQERQTLLARQAEIEAALAEAQGLRQQTDLERTEMAVAEGRLERRARLNEGLQEARQRQAEARAENPRLKAEMDELKDRIDQLKATEGAECPLCGQPLSPYDRAALVERLQADGTEMGDRYRTNQTLLQQSDELVRDLETQIAGLAQAETDLRTHGQALAKLNSRLDLLETAQAAWSAREAPRLEALQQELESESYAPEAHLELERIDAALKAIGYDAAAHDAARQAEEAGRASEAKLRGLESARAALAPLEREIAETQALLDGQGAELERQGQEHLSAQAGLTEARAQAPNLYEIERLLYALQEQENRLRMEVGAARQKVRILDELKTRRLALEAQREQFATQVSQYKQLERAFGKDGVPALLIEQALPEIESKANDTLDRLSGGSMSVRFVTQAAYKDRGRDDLRETLDIQISDSSGSRDYEMFSGGEAFRVNFAIRLALSEVLAQRAGARLQTLVIDEGFGSQDLLGRQRLIEAINLVRADFAKILVITHIDELKDAFPNRIEVEKTEIGSMVRVL
jgi:exonuclease SbcC